MINIFLSNPFSLLFKKDRVRVKITSLLRRRQSWRRNMTFEAKFSNENARELFCFCATETFIMTVVFRDDGRAKVSRTDSLINTSLDIHATRYRRSSSNLRLTTGRFEAELRIKAAKANMEERGEGADWLSAWKFPPDRVGGKKSYLARWVEFFICLSGRKFARDLFQSFVKMFARSLNELFQNWLWNLLLSTRI